MALKLAPAPSTYQNHFACLPPPTKTEDPILESHQYKPPSWSSNACEIAGCLKWFSKKEHLEEHYLFAHRKPERNIY